GPAASDATVYIGPKRPSDSAESNPGEALIREAVLRVIREAYFEQLFDDLNITSEVEKQLLKIKGSETTKIDPKSDQVLTIYYFCQNANFAQPQFRETKLANVVVRYFRVPSQSRAPSAVANLCWKDGDQVRVVDRILEYDEATKEWRVAAVQSP